MTRPTSQNPTSGQILAGARRIDLPTDLADELRTDLIRAAQIDRTREPLIACAVSLGAPNRLGNAHPFLTVTAFTPDSDGGIAQRHLELERTAPDGEQDVPSRAELPGIWELRAYCEEPRLVQFQDGAWGDRAREWKRPILTERPGAGWREVTGTRLRIGADMSVSEEVTEQRAVPWITDDIVLESHPVPYAGHVHRGEYGGVLWIIPEEAALHSAESWQFGDSAANDRLFPRCDGTLVRMTSAAMEDGYAHMRIHLWHERIGDAA